MSPANICCDEAWEGIKAVWKSEYLHLQKERRGMGAQILLFFLWLCCQRAKTGNGCRWSFYLPLAPGHVGNPAAFLHCFHFGAALHLAPNSFRDPWTVIACPCLSTCKFCSRKGSALLDVTLLSATFKSASAAMRLKWWQLGDCLAPSMAGVALWPEGKGDCVLHSGWQNAMY